MNVQRFRFTENHRAGIALALCRIQIFVIAFGMEIDLMRFRLNFLQAKHICLNLVEKIWQSFFDARANPGDVPRYNFHFPAP